MTSVRIGMDRGRGDALNALRSAAVPTVIDAEELVGALRRTDVPLMLTAACAAMASRSITLAVATSSPARLAGSAVTNRLRARAPPTHGPGRWRPHPGRHPCRLGAHAAGHHLADHEDLRARWDGADAVVAGGVGERDQRGALDAHLGGCRRAAGGRDGHAAL